MARSRARCGNVARHAGALLPSGAAGRARLSRKARCRSEVARRLLGAAGRKPGRALDRPALDQGTDRQRASPDGAAGGIGKLGVAERDRRNWPRARSAIDAEHRRGWLASHGRRRRCGAANRVELVHSRLDCGTFPLAARRNRALRRGRGRRSFRPAQAWSTTKRGLTVGQVLGLARIATCRGSASAAGLCLVAKSLNAEPPCIGGFGHNARLDDPGLGSRQHRLQARAWAPRPDR